LTRRDQDAAQRGRPGARLWLCLPTTTASLLARRAPEALAPRGRVAATGRSFGLQARSSTTEPCPVNGPLWQDTLTLHPLAPLHSSRDPDVKSQGLSPITRRGEHGVGKRRQRAPASDPTIAVPEASPPAEQKLPGRGTAGSPGFPARFPDELPGPLEFVVPRGGVRRPDPRKIPYKHAL